MSEEELQIVVEEETGEVVKKSLKENLKDWFKNIPNSFNTLLKNTGQWFKELPKKVFTALKTPSFYINNAIYILIILFILITTILEPDFLYWRSIVNIINQTALRLPIALGVAGIIVLTGTDLSAGRVVGFTSILVVSLLQRNDYTLKMFPNLNNFPIILVLLIVIVVGGLIGAFNGFFVAKFKLHPFIVTLSTQLIVYAASLIYLYIGTNKGQPLSGLRSDFTDLLTKGPELFGERIRWYTIYSIGLVILMWFIWNKTKLGKNMYAVGCNQDAANVSGISVFKTILFVFIMAGALYGVSGFFESANGGSATAATGANFELDAIAACVIGGISFSGGVGKIRGVVIGVFLLQLIAASLIYLGIDPNYTYPIKAAVILIAYTLDMRKYVVKK
jgi:methyl-galactoside transport system permease protein